MKAAVTQLEIVKHDIVRTKAKLEKAEQDGKESLILANTNLLTELYKKEQHLENSGIVLNLITVYLHSCYLNS
jgi:hypothetical protein